MSNVASLGLSEELYRLTGWEGSDKTYYFHDSQGCIEATNAFDSDAEGWTYRYDLGYLLRKLPSGFNLTHVSDGRGDYYLIESRGIPSTADAPEDAACKLAIELIKQKVLTP